MEENKQNVNQGAKEPIATGPRPAGFVPPRPPVKPPMGPPPVKNNSVQPVKPAQEQKQEQNQEEKKEKKKLTKKQWIIIGACALTLVIASVVILLVVNREKPVALVLREGTVLEFVKDESNHYIQASPQDPDVTYVYEIKIDEETIIILKSSDNTLDITQLITNPQVYSARLYIEKNGKKSAKTDWFNYNNYFTLEAPVLSLDSENALLSWQAVENARSYKIFYSQDSELKTHIFSPIMPEEIDEETEDGRVEFNLNILNLPLGVYVFRVASMPEVTSAFYKQSEASNAVTYKKLEKKMAPLSANYNLITKELQIDASNLTALEQFTIMFEGFNYTFTPQTKQNVYVINVAALTQEPIVLGQEIFVKVNSHDINILESDLVKVDFVN